MRTLSRFIIASLAGLVLSLALCGPGAFAQSVNLNPGARPATAAHSHDGPSPVYNGWDNGNGDGGYGNGGYGSNGGGDYSNGYNHSGYGGGGVTGWNHHHCTSHCGSNRRSASRCVRFTRSFRSNLTAGRQGYSSCKWIRGERW